MASSIALFFIAGHMIGDYVFQTQWISDRKLIRWDVRTLHVVLYALAFVPVPILAGMSIAAGSTFLLAVAVPHWIVDCRRWASPNPWQSKPLAVDQSLHAVHLAIVAAFFGL